jgi:cell division protein FtsB
MASPLRSLRVPQLATAIGTRFAHVRSRTVAAGGQLIAFAKAFRQFVIGLAALLALLAFMAAGPIRSLDAANQRVEYLQATKRQLTSSVTELEQRRAQLQDRHEIELLARTKFGLIKPGETAYVVVTPEDQVQADAEPRNGAGHRPWYRWLLDAVVDMAPT